ncbi:MAG: hypothetical protein MJ169_04805 [Treponema sp.]|nr:hypothetical protein [Treponema sp.]
MEKKQYSFGSGELLSQLKSFGEKGITELTVHDAELSGSRPKLVSLLNAVAKQAPQLYLNLSVKPDVIDASVINLAQNLYCTLDIPFTSANPKSDKYLFDKKLYSKKAAVLNNAGLVFGFDMDYAVCPGDSLKLFRDRIDFAASLYPNHIDFAQLYSQSGIKEKCTGTFSSQDIALAKRIAVGTSVFYSAGRAVPWFNIVISALKINPSKFLADFGEWLDCNNFSVNKADGQTIANLTHKEIEKMQTAFMEIKFEEKSKTHLFVIARDLVRLYGALSRVDAESEECELDLNFNPDDLLSPASLNLVSFAENVCMENCRIKVFAGDDCPDYKII